MEFSLWELEYPLANIDFVMKVEFEDLNELNWKKKNEIRLADIEYVNNENCRRKLKLMSLGFY